MISPVIPKEMPFFTAILTNWVMLVASNALRASTQYWASSWAEKAIIANRNKLQTDLEHKTTEYNWDMKDVVASIQVDPIFEIVPAVRCTVCCFALVGFVRLVPVGCEAICCDLLLFPTTHNWDETNKRKMG